MLQTLSRLRTRKRIVWESKKWRHLRFDNPLGISGGVDKNADMVRTWWRFGLGFVEVGTITPERKDRIPVRYLTDAFGIMPFGIEWDFPQRD